MNVLAAVFFSALMLLGGHLRAAVTPGNSGALEALTVLSGSVELCEEGNLTYLANSADLYVSDSFTDGSGLMTLTEKKEPEPRIYLEDRGGLFTKDEQEAVKRELEEFSRETGWCVGICTGKKFVQSEEIYWSVFREDSGVMLFINKKYAKLEVVGEAAEFVNGERAENIVRLTERSLRHEKYRKIPSQFGKRLISYRLKGRGSFDLYPPAFIIALIFGMAAGFGTAFFISRKYSVSEPPIVNNYLDVRSIEMYRKEDTLLSVHSVEM
ncbi:MAG: hypothetical protein K2N72_01315 [Oscillospiraceae bacterium]|nr:hypothetical protein [Oscillospiraceae bacterium]